MTVKVIEIAITVGKGGQFLRIWSGDCMGTLIQIIPVGFAMLYNFKHRLGTMCWCIVLVEHKHKHVPHQFCGSLIAALASATSGSRVYCP